MLKLSVLVPIYNVEKYLDECLTSLASQTLKDIEIICINDGSTDNSPRILQKYAKKYPNFVVINKQNSGYGDSMNRGLEKAKGEYVGIVESDDFIESDAFEKLYNLAKKNQADIVKANYFYHSKDGDELHKVVKSQRLNTPQNLADDPSILLEEPGIWSAIYRREFLKESNIKFRTTPGASYQDTGFHFKSLCAARKIIYTDEAYLHYRTDNSNSSVKSLEKVNYIVGEYGEIEVFIKNYNLPKEVLATLQVAKFGAYHWNLQRLPKKLAVEFAETIKQEFSNAKKTNLIQKQYFPKRYWFALQLILRLPPQFYCDILAIRKHIRQSYAKIYL